MSAWRSWLRPTAAWTSKPWRKKLRSGFSPPASSPGQELWPYQARKLLFGCGLEGNALRQGVSLIQALFKLAWEKEASLVEINPLVLTTEGNLIALDGKINFDDSALYRHKEIAELNDPEETDPLERKAKGYGLNYVRLNGNVGTMVNGAGLAMATMDVIKMAGAEPANFLDAGGGASEEMITHGFEIILSDPNVKAILINIFGGILRCDVLAAGVVAAARNLEIKVPLVVRLEGTNHEEGSRIMAESGLNFTVAADLADAAAKIAEGGQRLTAETPLFIQTEKGEPHQWRLPFLFWLQAAGPPNRC